MYGLQYTVVAPSTSRTVITDLLEITASTNKTIVLTSLYIGSPSTADMGDAQAEAMKVQIIKGNTVAGSGGTTPVARPLQTGYPAFLTTNGVVLCNNTTVASSGTELVIHEDNFNVQIGYQWRPAPNEYIIISGASTERVCIRLSAPADALILGGTLNFTVLG